MKTQIMPKKLNNRGCRLLAIAVIRSAIHDAYKHNEFDFFKSPLFHFYAGLAYGGTVDYRSDEDIINDILKNDTEDDQRKDNGGRFVKWF